MCRELASIGHEGFAVGKGGAPLFLCGASLGGCIAAHAARSQPCLYKGVILLCPMLSLERVAKAGWNPYLRQEILSHAGFLCFRSPSRNYTPRTWLCIQLCYLRLSNHYFVVLAVLTVDQTHHYLPNLTKKQPKWICH